MVFTASLFSALLYSLIIMFQLCLVAGKQWGHLAWGGLHKGKLPKKLRIASALSRSKPERYLWTPVAFAIAVFNALILVYFNFE